LPRRGTERLLRALKRLGIAVPAVVVNAVPPATCPRCGKATAAGLPRPAREGCAIIEAPATFPPPRGARDLAAWARAWTTTAGTG
ncbi:MAG TPA: hypothetical protein VFC23_02635, partial [Thermoanaerobaculia bacterium]|nr:hypothetical protein [Thermoanaerobaculia bacterium]